MSLKVNLPASSATAVATTAPFGRLRSWTRAAVIGVLSWVHAEPMTVVAWRAEAPLTPGRPAEYDCGEAPASENPARTNAASKAIQANFTSRSIYRQIGS